MAHRDQYRNRTGGDRTGQCFLIKGPKVFNAAASARDDRQIVLGSLALACCSI